MSTVLWGNKKPEQTIQLTMVILLKVHVYIEHNQNRFNKATEIPSGFSLLIGWNYYLIKLHQSR